MIGIIFQVSHKDPLTSKIPDAKWYTTVILRDSKDWVYHKSP